MTDQPQHRATPEQWAMIATGTGGCFSAALLELRARVKALEAAQQDKLDRLIALDAADPTPDPAMDELHAASAEAMPAGGLVERVATIITRATTSREAAEDVLGEVAAWFKDLEPAFLTAIELKEAAFLIRKEASHD
jgi:hypothetical protein